MGPQITSLLGYILGGGGGVVLYEKVVDACCLVNIESSGNMLNSTKKLFEVHGRQ